MVDDPEYAAELEKSQGFATRDIKVRVINKQEHGDADGVICAGYSGSQVFPIIVAAV